MSTEATIMTISEDLINPISRYIDVLIELYPTQVSQKELADYAGVSPSAVSKIKNKLFPFCSVETLAFNSRFVLELNTDLFIIYLRKKFKEENILGVIRLLSTVYAEELTMPEDVYNYLINNVPEISEIFDIFEISILLKLLFRYLRSHKISSTDEEAYLNIVNNISNVDIADEEFLSNISSYVLGYFLSSKTIDLNWSIDDSDELNIYMLLRDKVYCIICHSAQILLTKLDIKHILSIEEEDDFKRLSIKIIEHYIRGFFSAITDNINTYVINKDILYDEIYNEIGFLINKEDVIKQLDIIFEKYLDD